MMSACINSWLLLHVLCNRKNCILSLALIEALRSGGVSYIGVDVILLLHYFKFVVLFPPDKLQQTTSKKVKMKNVALYRMIRTNRLKNVETYILFLHYLLGLLIFQQNQVITSNAKQPLAKYRIFTYISLQSFLIFKICSLFYTNVY